MMAGLTFFVIFRRPTDFPEHEIVLRPHTILTWGKPHWWPIVCLCDSLHEARAGLSKSLVRFDREPGDDPVIVETWV
jgi:hypothetical protein